MNAPTDWLAELRAENSGEEAAGGTDRTDTRSSVSSVSSLPSESVEKSEERRADQVGTVERASRMEHVRRGALTAAGQRCAQSPDVLEALGRRAGIIAADGEGTRDETEAAAADAMRTAQGARLAALVERSLGQLLDRWNVSQGDREGYRLDIVERIASEGEGATLRWLRALTKDEVAPDSAIVRVSAPRALASTG